MKEKGVEHVTSDRAEWKNKIFRGTPTPNRTRKEPEDDDAVLIYLDCATVRQTFHSLVRTV